MKTHCICVIGLLNTPIILVEVTGWIDSYSIRQKLGNSLVLMRTAKCNTVEVLLPKWSRWPDFHSLEYMFIFETEGCANQLR